MSHYIHLHNHTHYSLLDGASTVNTLLKAAVDNNMPAVALTDHGVMFGAIEFYKKAKKKGIKPIIGSEVYILSKGSRFTKSTERDDGNDLLVTDGRNHDDAGIRMLAYDAFSSLYAFHLRHSDVHEHHIGLGAIVFGDGRTAITGLTGDGSTEGFDHPGQVLACEY